MSFALEKAKLGRYVKKIAVITTSFKSQLDNSEDCMEKVFAKEEKICEYEDNAWKAVAKMETICTDIV